MRDQHLRVLEEELGNPESPLLPELGRISGITGSGGEDISVRFNDNSSFLLRPGKGMVVAAYFPEGLADEIAYKISPLDECEALARPIHSGIISASPVKYVAFQNYAGRLPSSARLQLEKASNLRQMLRTTTSDELIEMPFFMATHQILAFFEENIKHPLLGRGPEVWAPNGEYELVATTSEEPSLLDVFGGVVLLRAREQDVNPAAEERTTEGRKTYWSPCIQHSRHRYLKGDKLFDTIQAEHLGLDYFRR